MQPRDRFAGCASSASTSDSTMAEEAVVQEMQTMQECCSTKTTAEKATAAAMLRRLPGSSYDAVAAAAAAALALSTQVSSASRLLPEESQPASVAAVVPTRQPAAAGVFLPQGPAVSSSASVLGLLCALDTSNKTTTSNSGSVILTNSDTKKDICAEGLPLGGAENSGACSTSCSTTSSTSPTTSSNSPTTSCLGATRGSSCNFTDESHPFSLLLSSGGVADTAALNKEVLPSPLSQRGTQDHTAASAQECIKAEQKQHTAAAADETNKSHIFGPTNAAPLRLQRRQEKLHASAALAAALAAIEASKLQRAAESETTLPQQSGMRCGYGEDSAGEMTAEVSSACADITMLMEKQGSLSTAEKLSIRGAGSYLVPATAPSSAPPPPPATNAVDAAEAVGLLAATENPLAEPSTSRTDVPAQEHLTTGTAGSAVAELAAKLNAPTKEVITIPAPVATTTATAIVACDDACAASTAAPGGGACLTKQPRRSPAGANVFADAAVTTSRGGLTTTVAANTGGCATCTGVDSESSESTTSRGSSRTGSYSGVSSGSSDSEKSKACTLRAQESLRSPPAAAGMLKAETHADTATTAEVAPADVAGGEAPGSVTPATTAAATWEGYVPGTVENTQKEEETPTALAPEQGTATAEKRCILSDEKTRLDCNRSDKLLVEKDHQRPPAAKAASVTSVHSAAAAADSSVPTVVGVESAAAGTNVCVVDGCLDFLDGEPAEKGESSSDVNSRSVTITTDRSTSNTSTTSDDCVGTEKCFSALLSAAAGSLSSLAASSTQFGPGEEAASSFAQSQGHQHQLEQAVEDSTGLLSGFFPGATTSACSVADKLKLLLSQGSITSPGLALWGLDQTVTAGMLPSAAADASAAAAVATWLSSLLPQQQKLCATASAALLPGLFLQPNISCGTPTSLVRSVCTPGAPTNSPSEKPSSALSNAAATKEEVSLDASSREHTAKPSRTSRSGIGQPDSAVPVADRIQGEATDCAVGAGAAVTLREMKEKAQERTASEKLGLHAEQGTQLTPLVLPKQSHFESRQQQVAPAKQEEEQLQQQNQPTSPVKLQVSLGAGKQLQDSQACAATVTAAAAADPAGVTANTAYLLSLDNGRALLQATATPAAAPAANVPFASFASPSLTLSSSSATTTLVPSASPPAVTCSLPGGVLPSSLLLSSAAGAPVPSSLTLLSSLPSAVATSNSSPVVAAVAQSLASGRSTLFGLPSSGVRAAGGTGLLLPGSTAAAVARNNLHTDGLAATMPATPVLTAAAGAMLPSASSVSPCVATPPTAATTATSSVTTLAGFHRPAATLPVRLQQVNAIPDTAGQHSCLQQLGGKNSLLNLASSPQSSPSLCATPLPTLPSSSASPSLAALTVASQADLRRSSRLLPPLAVKAAPSQASPCRTTAARVSKKAMTTSPRHGAAPLSSSSIVGEASTTAATSAVPGSAASAVAHTATRTAAATLVTTGLAGTPAHLEKRLLVPTASPFSTSTAAASAFSSPSPTPLGGPVPSPPSSSTSRQLALPLLSQSNSTIAFVAAGDVAAPAPQLQQLASPLPNTNAAPRGESASVGVARETSSGVPQSPAKTASLTRPAAAVASTSAYTPTGTAVTALPFSGLVDSGFWGATAQQLLLQLNMQQLEHHERQQQGHFSSDGMNISTHGVYLPPLCISPLAAAAAVAADSSTRPFSLARMHPQQVAAAFLPETVGGGGAAVALRGAGGTQTTAAAANTTSAAHSNNITAILNAVKTMEQDTTSSESILKPLQTSQHSSQLQQHQPQEQTCGSSLAETAKGKPAETDQKPLEHKGDSTIKQPGCHTKEMREQRTQDPQQAKQPPLKQQQQVEQRSTKQQRVPDGSTKLSGAEGPPVKRARGTEDAASLRTDSLASGTSGGPAQFSSSMKSGADIATLKRLDAVGLADRDLLSPSSVAAATLTGVQRQLLAQLQRNQLLLQRAATNEDKGVFDSRLQTVECSLVSEPAIVPTPAATATAACVDTATAMPQGVRHFVETLSSPAVAALSAAAGAAGDEAGAAALTAAASAGSGFSALLPSRPNGGSLAAASLAACFPPLPLLPRPDIGQNRNNADEAAAAAAALHIQALQQLQRLQKRSQHQQQGAITAATSLGTVECRVAGAVVTGPLGKSSTSLALPLPQQQQHLSPSRSSVALVPAGAAGGKVLPDQRGIVNALSRSDAGVAAAAREGRATDSAPATGGSTSNLRGAPRQQKRPARQEQQPHRQQQQPHRQQQRQATSLQRQEQTAALQNMHQHHPGVCYSPPKDVWRARITVEGRQHEQQFSVKRHGFEEARLLAVQWRSQMEKLRLGGADGRGGTVATEGCSGGEAATVTTSGAKTKGAGGTIKGGSSANMLTDTNSSSSGSKTHSISNSSSGATNVVQYVLSSSSTGKTPGKSGLPNTSFVQQDIAKGNPFAVAQQLKQRDLANALAPTSCTDPTYGSITQLTTLNSTGCRSINSLSSRSPPDANVRLPNGDPLSQMRSLALSARHLMQTKSLCAGQQPSGGIAAEGNNGGACSTAMFFRSPLLSLLDSAVVAGEGGGKAFAAGEGVPDVVASAISVGEGAPPVSLATVPALPIASRPAAPAAATGCT